MKYLKYLRSVSRIHNKTAIKRSLVKIIKNISFWQPASQPVHNKREERKLREEKERV